MLARLRCVVPMTLTGLCLGIAAYCWISVYFVNLSDADGDGLRGFGILLVSVYLAGAAFYSGGAGCCLALVGYLLNRPRLRRAFAVCFCLNLAAGPIPIGAIAVQIYLHENPPLLRDVRSGDLGRVQSELRNRPRPLLLDREAFESLQAAAAQGRMDLVDVLIDAYRDALPDPRSPQSRLTYEHALGAAAGNHQVALVRRLLAEKVDLRANRDAGQRAAIAALRSQSLEVCRTLLDAGCSSTYGGGDVNLLLGALAGFRSDFVELLLKYDRENRIRSDQAYGAQLLTIAADRWKPATLEKLLDAGADPNGPLGMARRPLEVAIERTDVDMVRLLLRHGADPKAMRTLHPQQSLSDYANELHQSPNADKKRTSELIRLLASPPDNK